MSVDLCCDGCGKSWMSHPVITMSGFANYVACPKCGSTNTRYNYSLGSQTNLSMPPCYHQVCLICKNAFVTWNAVGASGTWGTCPICVSQALATGSGKNVGSGRDPFILGSGAVHLSGSIPSGWAGGVGSQVGVCSRCNHYPAGVGGLCPTCAGQVPGASFGGHQTCHHCGKQFPVFYVFCGAPFAICSHCNKPQLPSMMYPNHNVPSSHPLGNPLAKAGEAFNPFDPQSKRTPLW